MKKKKVYVASSWRNKYQSSVVCYLKKAGFEVYDFKNPPYRTGFSWSNIDKEWKDWSTKEFIRSLNHPLAIAGFDSDFNAMNEADACIMVLPCGRSANAEAGWMKGAGKKVFVFSPEQQEPELMYKMFDLISDDFNEIMSELNK